MYVCNLYYTYLISVAQKISRGLTLRYLHLPRDSLRPKAYYVGLRRIFLPTKIRITFHSKYLLYMEAP